MGRRTGFLLTSALAVIGWLALAGSAQAEGVEGVFIVVDGPLAGKTIDSDATGKVSVKGQTHGFVRPADGDCPMRHFEGVDGGKGEKKVKVKETDCVRVVTTYFANEFLEQLSVALIDEDKGKLKDAITALEHAGEGLQFQEESGTVAPSTTLASDTHLKKAATLDKEAQDVRKDGDKKRADALVERAEHHKHAAGQLAPDAAKMFLPPKLQPIEAVFDSANRQTVYTENPIPRPGSTINYRFDLVELNDPSCILFESGKPQPNQAIWHHGDNQGPCNHGLEGSNGHQGVIAVTTYDNYYLCNAVYFGSNTGKGPQPPNCNPPGPQ